MALGDSTWLTCGEEPFPPTGRSRGRVVVH